MNRLTIIGNLTHDPDLRHTPDGTPVCNFSVAVNKRKTQNNQNPEADFFRVTAWRQLGENCAKYLSKGRKVAVVGPVSVNMYQGNDGNTRASLEVLAIDVEFLSCKGDGDGNEPVSGGSYSQPQAQAQPQAAPPPQADPQSGYQQVDTDELPW